MSSGKPKKTINDMPQSWHADHAQRAVPEEWAREVGIGDPKVSTPEDLAKAWQVLHDLNLVGDMINDMVAAIATIRAHPETTSLHRDTLRHIAPIVQHAAETMRSAGEICDKDGLKLDSEKGE